MAKKVRGFIRYKSYLFTDKDPIIDFLRMHKADKDISDKVLSDKSDVGVTTISNWFKGKTRRPQFATVAAVANALGVTSLPTTAAGRRNGK